MQPELELSKDLIQKISRYLITASI
jgi:hypothetical protein